MKNKATFAASLALAIGIFVIGNVVIVAQSAGQVGDREVDQADKAQVIEAVLENLKEAYVFPEVAKQMDNHVRGQIAKGEYGKITSAAKFADKLTEDLQAISKDKHLRVRYSHQPLPIRNDNSQPTAEEVEARNQFMKQVNFGFEKIERLQGNIGYIELRGFMDPELGAKTVAAAMNFVANTDALIFDLRRNGGGSPAMVALICSYLYGEEKVHLNDLYWRQGDRTDEFWTMPDKVMGDSYAGKDVYVLTSNRTFSGAEEFSYNLKNLKRGTIVGETTGGGAHPGGVFRLSDHFSAFISTGRAISPITKTNWEGTGVIPDVAVSKEIAFETAYKMALSKSLEKASDENTRRNLSAEISRLEKEIAEKSGQ